MSLTNDVKMINKMRDDTENFVKNEVFRVTGRKVEGAGKDVFTVDNLAIVNGGQRPPVQQVTDRMLTAAIQTYGLPCGGSLDSERFRAAIRAAINVENAT